MEWFNGTHIVRARALGREGRRGITIETATADGNGNRTGEWVKFVPGQNTHSREILDILAEGLRFTHK